ncbi:acyl-CoA/acyl-ACP dehydrogenase [Actinocrinis puniceicyclus]|uniref:Acyl-CoA/acyl-ACP dehydrogenase n=1 Tax=Actinocrinis puniceicyclus TaxID=977794 RepID=A0A8J7WQ47_9ACTN|nr:acyl-CoA dehydrogenase family protein [Actinocrinis puniceicyclus]MBS2966476.1 acyl-CoA/acyl-ACP dehydrogenase [Actinocrinis puniceicyclus]
MLAETAPGVAELTEILREQAAEADIEARLPEKSLAALRDSGLMGLLVPVEYGGLGGGLDDLVAIAMRLAGGCLSTAMVWAMHCQQVDAVIRHGQPRLHAELLPRIAAGEVYLASVTTEPRKGGHLLSASSPVQSTGTELTFERDAPVVTGGMAADGFLITMRAAEDAAAHEVTLIYADRDQMRIEVVGDWNPTGMRATDSRGLRLSGRVPEHSVVGEPGAFRTVALDSMIPLAHLGWSACWLGAARGVMRELTGALRNGSWTLDLGSELVRERLARVRVDLELVAGYLGQVRREVTAARRAGTSLQSPTAQIHLNVLKVAAAELTFQAADRLVQLTGLSRGYSRDAEIPVERVFRDLRSASLNYANDRLLGAIGSLVPLDRSVRLAGFED